jgi:hypothetical protein
MEPHYFEVIQSMGLDDKVYYTIFSLARINRARLNEVCRTTKLEQALEALKDALKFNLE